MRRSIMQLIIGVAVAIGMTVVAIRAIDRAVDHYVDASWGDRGD
jgi:hypothetical protein